MHENREKSAQLTKRVADLLEHMNTRITPNPDAVSLETKESLRLLVEYAILCCLELKQSNNRSYLDHYCLLDRKWIWSINVLVYLDSRIRTQSHR